MVWEKAVDFAFGDNTTIIVLFLFGVWSGVIEFILDGETKGDLDLDDDLIRF